MFVVWFVLRLVCCFVLVVGFTGFACWIACGLFVCAYLLCACDFVCLVVCLFGLLADSLVVLFCFGFAFTLFVFIVCAALIVL